MGLERAFTRRQLLALGVGAGAASTGLGGPLLRRAWGRETTVKAGYFALSAFIQYYAAKERGLFQAEGLKLEDAFVPGHLVVEGVVSGQVEFTFTNTLNIAQINLKGVSIKILYPGVTISEKYPYTQLVVPAGSPVKAAKDLEGKKIAVTQLRTTAELTTRAWLAANGADPEKVSFVGVGFDGIIPALKSKQFDAAFAIEPDLVIIKAQKLGEVIANPYLPLGPEVLLTGYIARESWIDKNPETAQAVVRVLDKATQWLMANPREIPGIIVRNTRMDEGLASRMIHPGLTRVARKTDLQPLLDMSEKFKFLPRSLDACTLFSKYCPQAC